MALETAYRVVVDVPSTPPRGRAAPWNTPTRIRALAGVCLVATLIVHELRGWAGIPWVSCGVVALFVLLGTRQRLAEYR